MEQKQDAVHVGKLQVVSQWARMLENAERADILGGQLTAKIAVREPDPLARLEGWARVVRAISLSLLLRYLAWSCQWASF